MSTETRPVPAYQIGIARYIHPHPEEAMAFKLHSLTIRLDIKDLRLQADLNYLLACHSYGLHRYKRSVVSWLPFRKDWISVMDIDDLKKLVLASSNLPFSYAEDASESPRFNIGGFSGLKNTYYFFRERELLSAEPLIRKAITRFLDKVITYGPYPDKLRMFQLAI